MRELLNTPVTIGMALAALVGSALYHLASGFVAAWRSGRDERRRAAQERLSDATWVCACGAQRPIFVGRNDCLACGARVTVKARGSFTGIYTRIRSLNSVD